MADDISTKTIPQISKLCEGLGKKPPSGLKKADLIEFYVGLIKMKREGIPFTEKYTGDDLPYDPVYMELRENETWLQHLHRTGWATVPVLDNPEQEINEFYYFGL